MEDTQGAENEVSAAGSRGLLDLVAMTRQDGFEVRGERLERGFGFFVGWRGWRWLRSRVVLSWPVVHLCSSSREISGICKKEERECQHYSVVAISDAWHSPSEPSM